MRKQLCSQSMTSESKHQYVAFGCLYMIMMNLSKFLEKCKWLCGIYPTWY